MNAFMVIINLPESLTPEFLDLIPQQLETVKKLMTEGKITSYSLSVDRLKLWINIEAETKTEVNVILNELPILPFVKFRVHQLMFSHHAQNTLTQFSLN